MKVEFNEKFKQTNKKEDTSKFRKLFIIFIIFFIICGKY